MTNDVERARVGEQVTMYRRGKKRIWCADFWHDGKHRRVSLKTANKKVALPRALRLDAQLGAGTFQERPPVVTIEQAVADFLSLAETEGRRRSTRKKYKGIFKIWTAFLKEHGITRLGHFNASLFDSFRAFRKQKGKKRSTRHTEDKLIKQLFRWAKSRRLLAENPVADYKLDRPRLEPKGGPSLGQVNQILAAISEADRIPIATLTFTGMRRADMCGLQTGDVDLEGNWIHIRSRDDRETKSGLSRKVPIHARLRPLLEAQLNRSRLWLFQELPTTQTSGDDRPLDPDGLNERFVRAVTALGMPAGRKQNGFTLHSLRRFFETFCVNAGIPQRVVDTWLGHRSDQSMAAVYYKLRDEDSQSFMAKVPFGIGESAISADHKEVER